MGQMMFFREEKVIPRKPKGETDYIRWLKNELSRRQRTGEIKREERQSRSRPPKINLRKEAQESQPGHAMTALVVMIFNLADQAGWSVEEIRRFLEYQNPDWNRGTELWRAGREALEALFHTLKLDVGGKI